MSFSAQWQQQFAAGRSHSTWPWTDLVSEVKRRIKPGDNACVLELGPGIGANVPLFLELGAQYHAIEGSAEAARTLAERFPAVRAQIVNADFTEGIGFAGPFDMIVDRSAVTHNTERAIRQTLDAAYGALRSGGWYVGVDWFSPRGNAAQGGIPDADERTFHGFGEGRFAGIGRVHFSDEAHLRDLFARFEIETLYERIVASVLPERRESSTWCIVGRKP